MPLSTISLKGQRLHPTPPTVNSASSSKSVQFILISVEAFNENDLFNYNIGLGGLTKFVKLALNLR